MPVMAPCSGPADLTRARWQRGGRVVKRQRRLPFNFRFQSLMLCLVTINTSFSSSPQQQHRPPWLRCWKAPEGKLCRCCRLDFSSRLFENRFTSSFYQWKPGETFTDVRSSFLLLRLTDSARRFKMWSHVKLSTRNLISEHLGMFWDDSWLFWEELANVFGTVVKIFGIIQQRTERTESYGAAETFMDVWDVPDNYPSISGTKILSRLSDDFILLFLGIYSHLFGTISKCLRIIFKRTFTRCSESTSVQNKSRCRGRTKAEGFQIPESRLKLSLSSHMEPTDSIASCVQTNRSIGPLGFQLAPQLPRYLILTQMGPVIRY